ncbi:MAG: histidine kinase dimerization/phosphoacceptor domain -containing protein [Euryarchaeota archaeon]|uniref:sensor histidine kinase n=1 Tax=Methanobacterium sp. MZD130B TaxID=3394378 RepID=UPI0017706F86|nr:histidine kinase dimerization/phosphoacceptor domain -containing protein [Euryarchaeota archaeon]HHT19063.1 response regulator [Methanobacterium sp.]
MAHILIVEDEVVEVMYLKNSLQLMGYDVLAVASSGDEAIDKAKKLKPDLILMDVVLKGDMDGIEAAKHIKKFKIPIIFLTGLLDDRTVSRALLSEPYGYIIKPFDNRKLKISIEVALYKDRMEKRLKKSQEDYYHTIFENTGTATAIIEEDKTLSLVNTEFSNLTGYSKEEIEHKIKWTKLFAPEELSMVEDYHYLRRVNPDSAPKNYETRLVTRNNDIKDIHMIVAMIPGTKKSMVSVFDITQRKIAEDNLKKSLKQKEILLREIHHRVKNNLQVISSLLSLQKHQFGDTETADILNECKGRVRAMAMIHENLYHSNDINNIDFGIYLNKMLSAIQRSYQVSNSIKINTNVEDVLMGIETAMPCGLIINELSTNSIKHAFPNRDMGNIFVQLESVNDSYVLTYADDGIGIPENINSANSKKLGLLIVETLVNQLNGVMEIDRSKGTKFVIKFRELPYQDRTKL